MTTTHNSVMRNPVGRARGTGSSRDGAAHHWMTNVTAVGLIPLSLWFVCSVLGLVGADYATFIMWLGQPVNATLMIATVVLAVYHAQMGVQEVLIDYVHCEVLKTASLIALKLVAAVLGLFMTIAVLKVAVLTTLYQAVTGG